ncbi:2,3-bisphosphoglycerate-dependent phosphoglycerate mutase [Pedobacter psychrophilus]|uniref:2,3-bisphosphoglycerate-dependent phosphoglycerate mutase n=1 Tax=Pedobacter psychrophilus TaxID=1826909 RepID=A0A179DIQ7_9SPHI|nr:2,3-diphosphoglycerate-dependent phosphoglycerate mutase [Pedobacter psychrophilus]OAQ40764.1 2,3-bisphosphoglycerate-dependent phosphoglycerate mutase [Pedobacter psychrophilus]
MDNKLILVRHGQSVWNLENKFTGQKDVELSPKGEEEAKDAGELLKSTCIDKVYTSTLIRAKHTYEIIKKISGLEKIPVVENKALNERKYGDLEGLNKFDTIKEFGIEQVQIWRRSFDVRPPNGESLKDTYDRVVPYFNSHIKKDLDKGLNILIVAHGNSLRALIMYLENISKEEIMEREIATGVPLIYNWPIKIVNK